MVIERIEEFQIDARKKAAILQLLRKSFTGYPDGRTYYKQLPDFRYLVWEGELLAGHMGVEHRVINNDGQVARIFGIVDLCVARSFQNRQLAKLLLQKLEQLGAQSGIDFLVLLAGDPAFYLSCGYQSQNNLCQWVMIHAHQTIGATSRRLDHNLMIKPLGDKEWLPGPVDFLGPLF